MNLNPSSFQRLLCLCLHSCTSEDAAIYQASASNSKGIVSCSGVLEVGEMNEFKIHQRYFAKLKQKARRCKEEEGKENLEPLRAISPDRTPRKRRSTLEGSLSTPVSDQSTGEPRQAEDAESELEETSAPMGPGGGVDGLSISENGRMSGTHTYDGVHKSLTAHQAKSPFTKKIKIFQVLKSYTKGEGASEEQRAKDESFKHGGTSEEGMDVDGSFTPPPGSRSVTQKHKETEELPSAAEPPEALNGNGACVAAPLTGSKAEGEGPAAKVPDEASPGQKLIPDKPATRPRVRRPEDVPISRREEWAGAAETEPRPPHKDVPERGAALPREVRELFHMSS